jgi:hypothetical protein
MEHDIAKEILKRLDILINLKLTHKSWENSTDQDRIRFLDKFGLRPSEIAEILDSSGDKVSKQLYAIKAKKNKNGR